MPRSPGAFHVAPCARLARSLYNATSLAFDEVSVGEQDRRQVGRRLRETAKQTAGGTKGRPTGIASGGELFFVLLACWASRIRHRKTGAPTKETRDTKTPPARGAEAHRPDE